MPAAGAILLFRSAARWLGISAWFVSVPILAAYSSRGQYGSEAHINGFVVPAPTAPRERTVKHGAFW